MSELRIMKIQNDSVFPKYGYKIIERTTVRRKESRIVTTLMTAYNLKINREGS